MDMIIKVNYENPNRPTVSGRELHRSMDSLKIQTL